MNSEQKFLGEVFVLLEPPEYLGSVAYGEKFRYLSTNESASSGPMSFKKTPWMIYPLACVDNPKIRVIVAPKSAQIAWTEAINTFIGKTILVEPTNIIVACSNGKAVKKYCKEKLHTMLENTRVLQPLLIRLKDGPKDFVSFKGGYLKVITAGSISDLKSSSVEIIIVEEPDDASEDLKGQGDVLAILSERVKSFHNSKIIFGGTPSVEGRSRVYAAFKQTNQMYFRARCHKCANFHKLDKTFVENLIIPLKSNSRVTGYNDWDNYDTDNALYRCPNCLTEWDDSIKEKNILESINYHNLGWEATAEGRPDTVGFQFCEIVSNFPGSRLSHLAEKYCKAKKELAEGKPGKYKSFVNNTLGVPYSLKEEATTKEADALKSCLDYPLKVIPYGGLGLTCGIDVQGSWFSVLVRAWGRNNNSWLIDWVNVEGNVYNREDPCWIKLREVLLTPYVTAQNPNKALYIEMTSMDSGDGNTADLVYQFCASLANEGVNILATKGSSETGGTFVDIFNAPTIMQTNSPMTAVKSLAETYGVTPYTIGTTAAKDEIFRKLKLTGTMDRMFYPKDVSGNYLKEIYSNVKTLTERKRGGRSVQVGTYLKSSTHRDEALDCEVLALHASRALLMHSFTASDWQGRENAIIGGSSQSQSAISLTTPQQENTFGIRKQYTN